MYISKSSGASRSTPWSYCSKFLPVGTCVLAQSMTSSMQLELARMPIFKVKDITFIFLCLKAYTVLSLKNMISWREQVKKRNQLLIASHCVFCQIVMP